VLLQLKQLEEQFQSEKQEKEIELLKKDQELQALALSRERSNVVLVAIALLSVLMIGGLLINRYRVMNRAKRTAEMESMRNTIARDLHDDIGSTLSSINIMSQIALQQNGNSGQQHLQKIANHSARMMENMSDIAWSINPKNDSLEQLVTKMKEFASEILEPKEIDYKFYMDSSLLNSKIDVEKRKNIFLIFKEAINNTAKYSCGSQVTISLFERHDNLHMTVGDNGKGFDSSLAKKGNGLRNMEDRAKTMKGDLKRISNPGSGTQIELEVPLT
jgi:signal transduction histidine kinase